MSFQRKQTKHTGTVATLDPQGHRHVIDEYTDFIWAGTLANNNQWIRGLREYRLGRDHCNVLDERTFQVITTGVKLTRVEGVTV